MAAVLETLNNRQERLERIVLCELLHRALYLHRFVMKYSHIMNATADATPTKLIETAKQTIGSSECTERFLGGLGLSLEDILATDRGGRYGV